MGETRRRIVEAAVELHTSVGPAHTSVAAIADRAAVQRHTVYAHFPDRLSLFRACSAHWRAEHPLPEVAELAAIKDPRVRLRAGLTGIYGWYEDVERDLALFIRDSDQVPEGLQQFNQELRETLRRAVEHGWPRRKGVRAAIGHALEFSTWQSLCRREGLSRREAVEAMLRLADSA
jgi:AcrR family transcriptional regulator